MHKHTQTFLLSILHLVIYDGFISFQDDLLGSCANKPTATERFCPPCHLLDIILSRLFSFPDQMTSGVPHGSKQSYHHSDDTWLKMKKSKLHTRILYAQRLRHLRNRMETGLFGSRFSDALGAAYAPVYQQVQAAWSVLNATVCLEPAQQHSEKNKDIIHCR